MAVKLLWKKRNRRAKTGAVKSVKKKIIKRIIKQKVTNKSTAKVNTSSKQVDDYAGEHNSKSDIGTQQEESSAGSAGINTCAQKKITKKDAAGKTDQSEDNGVPLEAIVEMEMRCSEDKPKDIAYIANVSVKSTLKKKIIKRVPTRKVSSATQAKDEIAENKNGANDVGKKLVQAGSETSNIDKR